MSVVWGLAGLGAGIAATLAASWLAGRGRRRRVAEVHADLVDGRRQLAEAQRIGHMGSWSWSPADRRLHWSAEIYRIHGVDPAAFETSHDAVHALIHPDDRAAVAASEQAGLAGGRHDIEHRIVRPDGTVRWVHVRAEADADGPPGRLRGTIQDVTRRRRAEAELRISENRLRRSLTFARLGVWEWSVETGELYWSPEVPELLGLERDLVVATYERFLAAVHPDDRAKVDSAVRASLETGADYDIEHRVVWPNGTVRWLSERGDVERDAAGRPIRMLGVVRDITARRADQEALSLFREVIEASEQAVGIADVEGRLVHANPAHRQLLDLEVGDPVWSVIPEDADRRVVAQVMASGLPWQGVMTLRDRTGRRFPAMCALGAVKGPDGAVIRGFNIFSDYSAELQRRRQLQAARDVAERADRAKSEFLSAMSHELRTPLNSILGFAQLLQGGRKDTLTQRQTEYVLHIETSGRHLLDLINEVLDLSRVESGRLDLNITAIPVDELLADCAAAAEALAERHGVTFSWSVAPAPLPRVRADATRLRQVLLNLLANGVKYNVSGGTVTLSAATREDRLEVVIADTGPGIAPERWSQLFQPFNRLGAERGSVEGTGIGLALTHRLVEAMDGRIDFTSQADIGTAFRVSLPLASDSPAGMLLYIGEALPILEEIRAWAGQAGLTVMTVADPVAGVARAAGEDVAGVVVAGADSARVRELRAGGDRPVIAVAAARDVRKALSAAGAHVCLAEAAPAATVAAVLDGTITVAARRA